MIWNAEAPARRAITVHAIWLVLSAFQLQPAAARAQWINAAAYTKT
jgi:hypothetical protein